MQHRCLTMCGEKLRGPVVELTGTQRHADRLGALDLGLGEVVVDARDGLGGVVVMKNRIG
ncbi:Uncharacterised protein [Mycobacteroides abscessus subsp. massiliense]|nr:Uncharacterised protein [Mycobacteroides abscessus subsp. massiliense]